MIFTGLDVVVTGGTGALGRDVVQLLLNAGARVHVPWILDEERANVTFAETVRMSRVDLSSEQAVTSFYAAIPTLWASIHVAGGFAMSPIESTAKADMEALFRPMRSPVSCLAARP